MNLPINISSGLINIVWGLVKMTRKEKILGYISRWNINELANFICQTEERGNKMLEEVRRLEKDNFVNKRLITRLRKNEYNLQQRCARLEYDLQKSDEYN